MEHYKEPCPSDLSDFVAEHLRDTVFGSGEEIIHLTGSRYIDPDGQPQDVDWLLNGAYLTKRPMATAEDIIESVFGQHLIEMGWVLAPHQNEYPDDSTTIYQKQSPEGVSDMKVDIIICHSAQMYCKWIRATLLAKAMCLTRKEQRKLLFSAICDDEWPAE